MSLLLNANQFITDESEYYKYTLAMNTHTVVVYLGPGIVVSTKVMHL